MIIIYPDESTFLGVSLFDEKIEKKEKEETSADKNDKNFQKIIIQMIHNLSAEMNNLSDKIKEIKMDINYLEEKKIIE